MKKVHYLSGNTVCFSPRYIYIPTLHKKTISNKIFSSFLCFTFVYIWHGTHNCILIWSVLNFVGITMETIFKNVRNVKVTRRVSCILATPLLAMSAISNFYFFAGTDVGNIFAKRFLEGECNK